ncbi:lectin subunit alpha [Musca domestica]|uniref:Lectin subunit alpha n=2 Tax=Musca domestica TaxID=7370 RepID=A0A9J7D7W6_MUSDO|nr:lectin subunit alpha [Musca domestica]
MKRIILVLVVTLLSMATGIAVEKWHKSEDGSLFYIDTEAKYNWHGAWNECARKNMSLIAIDSRYKHLQIDTLIKKLFAACPSFWIAGHDNAIDLRYEWATSGEIFSFTNWGPGQPDRLNNNEHCILIWQNTWQWYDLPCGHKLGFICEENRYIKEKAKELEILKKECQKDDDVGKSKNIALFINSKPTFEYLKSSN